MGNQRMGIERMRRIDATAGRAACAVLTLLRRWGVGRPEDPGPPRAIVVIKLAEQGATVAALPALRRAAELVGPDRVYVCVFAENRAILDELDVVPAANVLEIRTSTVGVLVRDVLRTVRRCRRLRIDAGVDLEFFSRSSAALLYLTGARRRAGLHSFSGEAHGRGDLMTRRVSANPLQHVSHTFRALVEALVLPVEQLPAIDAGPWDLEAPDPIAPSDDVRERARALVDADDRPPCVLLNPNAGDLVPLRRWPEAHYVDLARSLLERHQDLRILVTGASDEAAAAERLVRRIDHVRCRSVAGRTTMPELLALYWEADVLVTNDSGPAHYAALSPIDIVPLFGPESPAVFGPTSARSHPIWLGLPCSPCVNAFNDRRSPCRDNVCMQRIAPTAVADVVSELLAARPPR